MLLFAIAPLGCAQAPEVAPAPETAQTPAPAPPWRYAAALTASIPADLAVVPVFELADGHSGRAQIGVAVASIGAAPRLEVWDFDQNNPRERLERVGEARELVDLDAAAGDRGQLDVVRAAIARPGNEFVRERGLAGEPEASVAELVRLAAVVRDASAEPIGRAEALATLTRALDDHLFFTSNRLPALLSALTGGALEVASREPIGERRVALTLREPGHRLVFARTGERWALSEASFAQPASHSLPGSAAPAAEPSPTAP